MQKALITGGSSGIGYELANIMAAKGHDLVLVARDKKQLEQTQTRLTKAHGIAVEIVTADLSAPDAAKKLHAAQKNNGIEILVNNAGFGLKGNFFDDDLSRNQSMMHLNMEAVVELTYYFGNDFIKKDRGRILNTASVVSFFPGPKQPIYYATKAFVRSFSRALAYNVRDTNVTVTALHPGITKTNFFSTAQAPKQQKGASPASVAQLGYDAMMAGKTEVTHGLWNKFLTNVFVRIVPYRLQVYIVDRAANV